MKIQTALAVAFVASASVSASAQTQDEQNACIGDAFSVCGHAIPDRGRVAACLAENVKVISPACRTVMARYPKPGTGPRSAERQFRGEPRYADERFDQRRYDQRRYDPNDRRFARDRYDDRGPWYGDRQPYWNEPRYR